MFDDSTLSRIRHRQQEAWRLYMDTELTKLSPWVAYYGEDVLALIDEVLRLRGSVKVLEEKVKSHDEVVIVSDAKIKGLEEEVARLREAEVHPVRRTAWVELASDPLAGMVKK